MSPQALRRTAWAEAARILLWEFPGLTGAQFRGASVSPVLAEVAKAIDELIAARSAANVFLLFPARPRRPRA